MGLLNITDQAHVECLRLCFMGLIRNQLEEARVEWNTHYIQRNSRCTTVQTGKPDKMFFIPEEFGTNSFHCEFDETEVTAVEEELENDEGEPVDVNPEFIKLVNILVPKWEEPETVEEGLKLFVEITTKIRQYDDSQ